MISKWLFTVLAAAVMFVTTVELGYYSARQRLVAPVAHDLFAPEMGLPTATEVGPEPALTR